MRGFAAVVVAIAAAGWAAAAAAQAIDPFVGVFTGATDVVVGDKGKRDLTVTVEKSGNGFIIGWKTVIRDGGKDTVRQERVRFIATKRANIFSAGSRQDVFGKLVPIDPISGDAYYWARLRGRTLSVFNILIANDGGYEMQVYHRTLGADGKSMKVKFLSSRDGIPQRSVTGDLKRVK